MANDLKLDEEEQLILVRESNKAIGSADKMTVHRNGLLHRAFSVFLVDDRGRVLVQQRHLGKYHSGALWANTCCGHPRPGESTRAAAARRLREEMGLDANLAFRFYSRYQAKVGAGMIENEFVYVYFGRITGEPKPNPSEISAITLLSLGALNQVRSARPLTLAAWLRHYLIQHTEELSSAIRDELTV